MNRLIRLIAICFGSLILWTSPLQAQERSAVRAGFELPANSGKKILIFRPRISVGSQSTGGMFEPTAEWTDRATLNMQSSLSEPQQRHENQVVEAPDASGADALPAQEHMTQLAEVSDAVS